MIRLAAALTLVMIVFVVAQPARAQLNEQICTGTNANSSFCKEDDQTKTATPGNNRLYGPNGIVTNVVKILRNVVGVAAVIMIIVGGIRYVISSGDPNNINGAKNTILYALIGLGVALFAQAIIVFVISKV